MSADLFRYRSMFLKTVFSFTASVALLPITMQDVVHESNESIKFYPQEIGPVKKSIEKAQMGNGVRAIWVNPTDSKNIIFGTEFDGVFETQNGGKDCNQIEIKLRETPSRLVLRDVVSLGPDGSAILLFDKSLVLRTKGKFNEPIYKDITPKNNTTEFQSGCFIPKTGKILLGGWNLSGGLSVMDYQKVIMEINNRGDNFTLEFAPDTGIIGQSFIRFVNYDEQSNRVLLGGWGDHNNKCVRAGTGAVSLDATTLKPTRHQYELFDSRGALPLNSAKITNFVGTDGLLHEIAVFGSERSIYEKIHNKDTRAVMKGFLNIFIDGVKMTEEQVNCTDLGYRTGGNDIVTCAHGIEVISIGSEQYLLVSSYSQGISYVKLQEILNVGCSSSDFQASLEWKSISNSIQGNSTLHASHVRIMPDSDGTDTLLLARINESSRSVFPQSLILWPVKV